MRLDGMLGEKAIDSVAVVPAGCVWLNDHSGCVPLGAAIVTLMRAPARYACPWKYSGMTTGTNWFAGMGSTLDARNVGIGWSNVGFCLNMFFVDLRSSLRSLARIQPFW